MALESRLDRWFARSEALFARIDAVWDRGQRWIDTTAERTARAWVGPVLLALAATGAVVALLRLLLAGLLGAGPGGRWTGVALAGSLALVLLVVVFRNVLVSLVAPEQRRHFLIALMTSAAAMFVGVEAFAALTVALAGHDVPMWPVERFYLRHLVQAVPLLDIPARLEWSEPPVLPGMAGRVLALAFTLLVIPPLLRVGVAVYQYVEGRALQRRFTAAVASQVRRSHSGYAEPAVPVAMVAAAGAGAVWSVLGPGGHRPAALWSLAGLAALLTVAAVLVAAALVAGLVVFGLDDQPLPFALLPAIGLVWFDSPFRRALLPAAAHWGVAGRIGATLVVFIVVLVVVGIFLWADPELAGAVVGLGLVLGFLGADAPAAVWVREQLTWRPWGFAVDRMIIAAAAWFTVAYLLRVLWQSARRVPKLGQYGYRDTASDLREDLRGYTLVAVHIVIAAAAALTLLRAAGALTVTTSPGDRWSGATQALSAAAWHTVDSLPGPDVPGILDWRLTTDFRGPWAGLVVILAVAAVVVFAGFPLIRTVLVWARLAVQHPGAQRPAGDGLVATPAAVEANLRRVVAFVTSASRDHGHDRWVIRTRTVLGSDRIVAGHRMAAAEQRLVQATVDLPKLAELFGAGSPSYAAADAAVAKVSEAYAAYATAFAGRKTEVDEKATAALQALDEYTRVVERWRAAVDAAGSP
ncbi:hypothetical protein [Phytohabitans houttuyneae]|uniref:Uncharacterized protein n=1 Tax=Phytohabitans houttuyneae TaxID=1076126 RepID=A0A6V8K7L9_9ACTN|nr:hypothetical protein [Phytohabitans houttuyneae]GFJ81202.1 hypothetical protein Phou_053820 [Phytohabitans houttuyneae]